MLEIERKEPGRKLLFWIGPGWPLLGSDATSQQEDYFINQIVSLQNQMREARVQVFNLRIFRPTMPPASISYQNYQKGIQRKDEAEEMYLTLQVLAIASGGRVTLPSHDVAGEIARTVNEESVYYTLQFKPDNAERPQKFHELAVQIGQPGAVARLITGYYEAP